MRETGAALATDLTYILNMILGDLFLAKSNKFIRTRAKLDNSLYKEWFTYLKIGIPGALMLCFEWWAFEFLAIFSGYISVASLAAEVIIINIVAFIFMMPLGISFAASSLTGFYIGKGNVPMAKRYANLIMIFNIILIVFIIILMLIFNNSIARLFTSEAEVVESVRDALWIVMVYVFFDSIHGVQSGVIKGIGRQSLSSAFLLVCYYLFGMPMALIFAFKLKIGISGLWMGFTLASVILDIGFYFIINLCDWNQISFQI